MLFIVLVFVLAALGLLVTALLTANTVWAWVSVVLSVLAGLILLLDWLRRRSKRRGSEAGPTEQPNNEAAAEEDETEKADGEPSDPGETPAEQTELMPAAGDLDSSSTAIIVPVLEEDTEDGSAEDVEEEDASPARSKSDGDPGEEETDAADLLVVSELEDQVVVVDEYPRYHLVECVWLAERDTIPIEVSEARQLGFTPCVRCGPDAKLAAKHRTKIK
ncbi:MAG: hypothetical protein QOI21_1228 [Actinomycetota bacterium]|nr:hypothetical protein [Actinomycetota bacterium]